MQYRLIISLLGLVLLHLAAAQAPLNVTLKSYLVTEVTLEDGTTEERLVRADVAEPGQVLEYRLTLLNESGAALPAGIAATGPVPARTHYLAQTALGQADADLSFSADGGATFAPKPIVTVTDEDGNEQVVEAAPEQYSAVRWLLQRELDSGASRTFTYRVLVL